MCGIVGCSLPPGSPASAPDLPAALAALALRGPDGRGTWEGDRTVLGHTRLSIIDLETGDQPMANEDGSLQVIFNGEIYNYRELQGDLRKQGHVLRTTSDTEVILHLYEEHGTGCLGHLRGMFAFALWDSRRKLLFLARDRMGVKPLLYHEGAGGFFFASEIQALFAMHRGLSKDCDLAAIDAFLTLQYIPSPLTGFRSVRKLPPAHYMIVRDGRVERLERYWDIPYGSPCALSFPEACERLREILLESTRIRLRSDVPLGAFLSGGVDSSIVVAAMSRLVDSPVRTFTVGFGVRGYDETERAREVAGRFGTDHTEFRVDGDVRELLPRAARAFGEPFGDSSVVPTYYISEATSKHVKVALTGDGGDETFAGYKRFRQLSFLDRIERYRLGGAWALARRTGLFAERLVNPRRRNRRFPVTRMDMALPLRGADRYARFVDIFDEAEKEMLCGALLRENRWAAADYWDPRLHRASGLDRYLYADQTSFLSEDVLFKVDICSMMNSLECRSPLLDHKLVEFAASLPASYKLGGKEGKHILKEAFRDWFPRGFFAGPKVGFAAPTHVWLKGDLKEWCRETILGCESLGRLLRREAVERLFREEDVHHKRIWCLLALAQWMEAFGVRV